MIIKLDLSNIITEVVNNKVKKLSKSIFTVLRIMKMTLIPVVVCTILTVKVIVLIQIFTPEAAPWKFCKIPQKTFRKGSMFVTASDFWFTTLLKMNSTIDVYVLCFTNLARAVISHNTLELLLLCYKFL